MRLIIIVAFSLLHAPPGLAAAGGTNQLAPSCPQIFTSLAPLGKVAQRLVARGYPPSLAGRLERNYPKIARKILAMSKADGEPVTLYRGLRINISEFDPDYVGEERYKEHYYAATDLSTPMEHSLPTIGQFEGLPEYPRIPEEFYESTMFKFTVPRAWTKKAGAIYIGTGPFFVVLRKFVPDLRVFTTEIGTLKVYSKDAVVDRRLGTLQWPNQQMIWHRYEELYDDNGKLKNR